MTAHPEHVTARISFVKDMWRDRADDPHIYSRASRRENTCEREVVVHNARLRDAAGDLHLDRSGFVLVRHATTVTDFQSKDVVVGQYFAAMCELILGLTGAADAVAFPFYQVRTSDPKHFFDAYSLYMHCDYTPNTLSAFARSVLAPSGRAERYPDSDWDYAFYNLWRPIGDVVQRNPLVLIDASTVRREDIIDYRPVREGERGRAAVPLYHPEQRFYYVPLMRPDEVLVFKQLDSRPGHAFVCPHTSFEDPTTAPDAPDRRSIDIRFLCVFPKTAS